MSPEQVRGNLEAIGPTSDVYALGVLLYELVAGRPPHDLGKRSLPEAVRIIEEEEPTRLRELDTSLRGDVETIVERALAKEPERRYVSAAALAADVTRFLGHEPIVARPATTLYYVAKFAQRHRALVGGVARSPSSA